MPKAAFIILLLISSPAWVIARQQSEINMTVQGGEPAQGAKEEKAQPGQPLTNESILKLVKAGFSEDTIISMVKSQPGKYSLGADDLIALKTAGVPEKVIAAMVGKQGSETPATPAAPTPQAGKEPQPAAPVNEVGVYYKKAEEWVQVMPEVVNWQTGGVIKSHVSMGIVKGDVNGRIDGPGSQNQVRSPLEFLIYLQEGVEITEYQLVHLHEHHDSREFRTVTGGVFHQSGGAKRDTVAFEYKKIGPRTYRIPLPDLGPGEYGFLAPGAGSEKHASAQLGKMYTFHLLE